MGNCFVINFNLRCDKLLGCFTQKGALRQGKTIVDLQNNWRRLKAERDETVLKIEDSPGTRPSEQVNQWLERVTRVEGRIDTLLSECCARDQESANNNCFRVSCPRNCIKSYSLWKKIGSMDEEVLDLYSQVPDVVVVRPRVAQALQVPTEPTTGMQSMLDHVWSHIDQNQQDHRAPLIGLYGMGGIGKTTLLKAINNKLCSSALVNFDLQLWIVVSKTPNLDDIQNHLGEKIGFNGHDWKMKAQDEKAIDIYNVLCKKKYILLLDDLWERFDLVKIGVPLPNSTNKSMVIFTTRYLQVCGQMRATELQVQCLNDENSWNLFEQNVQHKTLCAHPDIPNLARVVMRECNGLPLALIVTGRAMALKTTVHDWKHAVDVLQSYATEFPAIKEEVWIPLKYSYDNLTNNAIRSCLLYCSLYAEDQEISKSDLVDKWISEGFVGRFRDLEKDRNEGYSYISTLVDASLLEKCSLEENVKMHDVIRDMSLWIAGDGFYVKAHAGLTEVPEDVKWGDVEKMSLMGNSIQELSNGPTEVTRLTTILIDGGRFSSINNDFLRFVPNLRVLDLSDNQELTSLPKEFCELVSLQYINLSFTNIKELPSDFRKLVKVKYLNVRYTKIHTISEGILSGMVELSVFRCGINRHVTFYEFLGENIVQEIEGLKYLNVWKTGISTIPKGVLSSMRLFRFRRGDENSIAYPEFLGENLVNELEGLPCIRDVEIPAKSKADISNLSGSVTLLNCITRLNMTAFRDDSTSLDVLFLKDMKHLRFLEIENMANVEQIVVGGEGREYETSMLRTQNGFSTLRHVQIFVCRRLKNLSWLMFFPNIECINVYDCGEMQTLVAENDYRLGNEVKLFEKLQRLYLLGVPKLESIYSSCLSFPCLNTLFVNYRCENLKKLPFDSSSCDGGRGITIVCKNEWWNELQWEDEATRTTFSSRLQLW